MNLKEIIKKGDIVLCKNSRNPDESEEEGVVINTVKQQGYTEYEVQIWYHRLTRFVYTGYIRKPTPLEKVMR